MKRLWRVASALPVLCRHPGGFRIPSHLTPAERATLYRLAIKAPLRPVLEIGSYLGASAYLLAAATVDAGRDVPVICVDTWHNDAMTEGTRDTFVQFANNIRRFSSTITIVRGLSHAVVEQVRAMVPEGLGMLFVDGDHSWECVRRDWYCYRPLLGPQAIVVFHDIGWADGVRRVVREEVMPLVKETGSLPNLWWGRMAK